MKKTYKPYSSIFIKIIFKKTINLLFGSKNKNKDKKSEGNTIKDLESTLEEVYSTENNQRKNLGKLVSTLNPQSSDGDRLNFVNQRNEEETSYKYRILKLKLKYEKIIAILKEEQKNKKIPATKIKGALRTLSALDCLLPDGKEKEYYREQKCRLETLTKSVNSLLPY